jgi:hypothetical protein
MFSNAEGSKVSREVRNNIAAAGVHGVRLNGEPIAMVFESKIESEGFAMVWPADAGEVTRIAVDDPRYKDCIYTIFISEIVLGVAMNFLVVSAGKDAPSAAKLEARTRALLKRGPR